MQPDEEHKIRQILFEQVKDLVEAGDKVSLEKLLRKQRESDIAEVAEMIDKEDVRVVFDVLDKEQAAEVLIKVDEATRREIFDVLAHDELVSLISEMNADDAADIILELPEETSRDILQKIPGEDADQIRDLLSYSEDSAGGIMDPMVISVPENATVAEAADQIRGAEIDEDFFAVYVVDKYGRFLGDARLRMLLTSPADKKVRDLVEPDTIFVNATDDQEEVRNVFRKNGLIVVPVLNWRRKLVGRITADRILAVAEEEAAEDMYTMAGTDPDELDTISVLRAARVRMTWLLPCLLGTGLTALVLMFFSQVFENQNLAIIYAAAFVFVPMIAAISGNAGLQTSTIVVSGLATGHLAALRLRQVFNREVPIAFVVALSCGLLGGLICAAMIHIRYPGTVINPYRIILAFTFAMFTAVMVATTLGLFLPFLFRRVGIDPAISSGPLVTTANDAISVAIYMTLTLLLAV